MARAIKFDGNDTPDLTGRYRINYALHPTAMWAAKLCLWCSHCGAVQNPEPRNLLTEEEITMKRLSVITMGLLFIGFTVFGCSTIATRDAGWITLIDGGKGLDNWNRIGDANWRAEDGAIVADKGKGGHLVSKNSYKDFQIRAEFWADHTTNSGIFIRISDPAKISSKSSYEVNIYDRRPDPSYGTGAIVDFAKVSPMPKAGGKWNTFEITAKGPQLTVVLNGVKTVDIQDSKFTSGPFSLQYGSGPEGTPGGAIKWRKVQIKPL
jgi:hypothetical protein